MHRFTPLIDPNMSFRFFDLPPELRLRVFEEVLEIKTNELGERDSIFCPQILRASKQCQTEGEPILYGKNEVAIDIDSEVRLIDPDHVYYDTITISIGGRIVTQGGTRASLGFIVCMAASWPSYVRKARKLYVDLKAYDMRDNIGVEGLLWSLIHRRLRREAIYTLARRGREFAPLSQLVCSLARAAVGCRELRLRLDSVHLLSDGLDFQAERTLSGMAMFANVKTCEVETLGEASGGESLRALVLGPVPTREEQAIIGISDAVRETQRTVAVGSQEAGYGIPALLPAGSRSTTVNEDDEADFTRADTPDLPHGSGLILQPRLVLGDPPGPSELVLWSAI